MEPIALDQPETPEPSRTLKVSETFVSLQGEGMLTGMPSWFVRLSGCNLRCRWCDTPYASWDPEGDQHTVGSLIDEARASGVRHAVVTGGEPMIFGGIDALCAGLHDAGMHVTIETAGTVSRWVTCDLMSLSPKLANSTPKGDPRDPTGAWATRHEERRVDLAPLQELVETYPEHQLKFVVTAASDLAEICGVLDAIGPVVKERVFLMPEGVETPDPVSIAWVLDVCRERGFRYGHRLHIELFGDTRGT
ncbi:MAG: 7-carboxy-7-deazaguanine synthase QueE [Planctomycetota bacterium]